MNATDRLTALRPTDATVDRLWSPDDRAATLRRVLDTGPAPTRRSRRPVALGLAAAAVAVVAVTVSLVLPGGTPGSASPAAAAELDRLATVAASAPFDAAGPDDVLHMVIVEQQTGGGVPENASGTPMQTTMESWTASDGTVWRKDSGGPLGGVSYFVFTDATDSTTAPTPAYLASLPTNAGALRDYLRSHVSGSNSTDEAVFTAVGDMLRGGFAPPALRVAALDVLKHTDHVTLGSAVTDQLGRAVVELDFVDQATRPDTVQALYFAQDSAEIVQESLRGPGMDYRSIVQTAEVVPAVPDEVLAQAGSPANAVPKS